MKTQFAGILPLICLAVAVASPLWGAARKAKEGFPDREIQILFIGNSYTEVGEIPKVVEMFGKSRKHRFNCVSVTYGGYTLGAHWDNSEKKSLNARSKLLEQKWDFVILQDQSSLPALDSSATLDAVKNFAPLIRKQGAKLLLYLTPAHREPEIKDRPLMNEEQTRLNAAYESAALAVKGKVIPVGPAFNRYYQRNPDNLLHAPDNSHFNRKGVYLAALIIYNRISGESPKKLPGAFQLMPKEITLLQALASEFEKEKKTH